MLTPVGCNTNPFPLGKMFTQKELEYIASVCTRRDVLVISDEVYERVTFDDNKHVRICSLPGKSR